MAKTKDIEKKFENTASQELEIVRLKKKIKALEQLNDKLMAKNEAVKEVSRIITVNASPEQQITESQIQYLKAVSSQRILTLEETKMLDIHIKNKRLLDDKSTMNADFKDVSNEVSDADLIGIASGQQQLPAATKKRNKSKASN